MITDILKNTIRKAISEVMDIDISKTEVADNEIEHPGDLEYGDYAYTGTMKTFAMLRGKVKEIIDSEDATGNVEGQAGSNAREFAEKIKIEIERDLPVEVASVEVAGPGFINFHLSPAFFAQSLAEIQGAGELFGGSDALSGRKTIFEYTTQNLMKEFHVGHLMSHVVGNAISNIYEAQGAEVKRDSYQGDVGMHIAKVVWAIMESSNPFPEDRDTPAEKANYLGKMYAAGDAAFADNETEIEEINKKIYEKTDPEINEVYEKACQWSLESYQNLYDRLGVQLDWQFFESETAPVGKEIVEDGLSKGVFEENDGAVIYRGDEEKGLHTRVFINSVGIPTYEAKDLGLMKLKYEAYPYDEAVIFTANEQNEYFKVVLAAAAEVIPDLAAKNTHIGHGILELSGGKMSSRTGDVLSAEKLLDTVKQRAEEKVAERLDGEAKEGVAEQIAQAAVRYSILKQDATGNVVFDVEQSLSFEGDSGPYLQYTHARCQSLLEKARKQGLDPDVDEPSEVGEVTEIEKLLYRFPEVTSRAAEKYAPHLVATYLHELAQAFNSFYGSTQIISDEPEAGYRLAITEATSQVLKNGLQLLGIAAPEEM